MSTRSTVEAILALQAEPQTTQTLAAKVGMSVHGARLFIQRLKDENFVEFKGWAARSGGATPALYGWKEMT